MPREFCFAASFTARLLGGLGADACAHPRLLASANIASAAFEATQPLSARSAEPVAWERFEFDVAKSRTLACNTVSPTTSSTTCVVSELRASSSESTLSIFRAQRFCSSGSHVSKIRFLALSSRTRTRQWCNTVKSRSAKSVAVQRFPIPLHRHTVGKVPNNISTTRRICKYVDSNDGMASTNFKSSLCNDANPVPHGCRERGNVV